MTLDTFMTMDCKGMFVVFARDVGICRVTWMLLHGGAACML